MLKYFHYRPDPKSRFGGTTVGFQYLDQEKTTMLVSFARCSEKDVFDKKKSRLITSGRMQVGKFEKVERPVNMDKYEFLIGLVKQHDEKVKSARGIKKAV